ncbi:hypothetical protein BGY98DRAFT_956677 [Russula aff. rugulosa BPL654]|nr:hypothetical protein BGY98DRAFT_956677 [Russula aff. rugulosa BPL654]
MLLPPRIEVNGRNTLLGIQQQAGEEVSSRVSARETTGCASWTGSTESLPPTPLRGQYAAHPGRCLVQTRDLWQSS